MNFKGNAVLRKLMPSLELSRGGLSAEGRNITADHLSELNRISMSHKVDMHKQASKDAAAACSLFQFSVHQICGFPLHFAYTDMEEILESFHATGAYLNREPGVEFALQVHVEPYPDTVMSVWVYLATMVRRWSAEEPGPRD